MAEVDLDEAFTYVTPLRMSAVCFDSAEAWPVTIIEKNLEADFLLELT